MDSHEDQSCAPTAAGIIKTMTMKAAIIEHSLYAGSG
jgi:hypothetical protein